MKITATAVIGAFALVQCSTALVIPNINTKGPTNDQAQVQQSIPGAEDVLKQPTISQVYRLNYSEQPSKRTAKSTTINTQVNNPSTWVGQTGNSLAKIEQDRRKAEAELHRLETQRKQVLDQTKKTYQQTNQQNANLWARASAVTTVPHGIDAQRAAMQTMQKLNAQISRQKVDKKAKDIATMVVRVARGFNA